MTTTPAHPGAAAQEAGPLPGLVRDGVLVARRVPSGAGGRDQEARLRQQAAVAALGQAALSAHDPRTVLDEAVRTVAVTLDVPCVLLVRRDRRRSVTAAAYGLAEGVEVPAGAATAMWHAVRDGQGPLVLRAPDELPVSLRQAVVALGVDVRSAAGVPVGSSEHPWGSLYAFDPRADSFDPDDVHFLATVANVVAAADARFRAEDEVRHRAGHDALTGLPNRDLLNGRLLTALAEAGDRRTALLLIDLDGFKDVNDSLGHQAGDEVLCQVAERLTAALAQGLAGVPRAMVARLGGDEFAVVLEELPHDRTASVAAAALVRLLEAPFGAAGGVRLAGSIGVALAPEHGTDPFALLQRADLAMYRAKRQRRGWAVHDPAVDEDAGARLARVADLRAAIEAREVTVAYQPVVDLVTHEVTSVEALARWNHSGRGPQEPADFVLLAEQSGLVAALTDVVVREAVAQSARWLRNGRGLPVAVNLSPSVLAAPGYPDTLRRLLADAGLPASMMRIEVTESALADDDAIESLHALRRMGIRIAVDDFGTGWSSLSRLKQLPVNTVKVDRSFVVGLPDDRRDVAIVRAVVALAGELGLRVIAEGVETADAARMLTRIGVVRAQGNLISSALDVPAFHEWYGRWASGDRGCCRGRPPR